MNDVIKWLESAEGETWSFYRNHSGLVQLVTVKEQDPSTANWETFAYLWVA